MYRSTSLIKRPLMARPGCSEILHSALMEGHVIIPHRKPRCVRVRGTSGVLDTHKHTVKEIMRETDKGKPSPGEEEVEGEEINRGSE